MRRYHRARGFTLIEVMVAIGIILLLVGILVVGITFVGRSAKERATRVTLDNAQSMFAELQAKTNLRNQPEAWAWRGEDYVPQNPAHAALSLNFFTAPYRSDLQDPPNQGFGGNGDGNLDTTDGPDPLDAPGRVEAGVPVAERYASRAVLNTQLVIGQFRSQPAIRAQLEQLPKDQQMELIWAGGRRAAPGPDGVLGTTDDVAAGEDIYYLPGNLVGVDGNDADEKPDAYYKCKRAHRASTPPTSGGADWDDESDMTGATRSIPILADAWNNPIIFVPAGGLAVRLNLDQTDATGAAGENAVIKSPDNRPFWASAGPDGNFRNGDDNVYSFGE